MKWWHWGAIAWIVLACGYIIRLMARDSHGGDEP